jgi:hypothetical protein
MLTKINGFEIFYVVPDLKTFSLVLFLAVVQGSSQLHSEDISAPWPEQKASVWRRDAGWLVGCNYTPSTAINQLEMWQGDTFDPQTIDRELGWAHQLGFNSVRVFLHNLLWQQDSAGFLKRMDQFLKLAKQNHIGVVFVLFDSCWDPVPTLGQQRGPRPFVHNSGWVQSPGREYMEHPERLDELKTYVQGVIGHFRDDPRIVFWDLYNEPDNLNEAAYGKEEPSAKESSACLLLKKTFAWARAMRPSQPLTSGVWKDDYVSQAKFSAMEQIQLEQSDIITFHDYGRLEKMKKCIRSLEHFHRPIICTEYMARPNGSTFDPILGYLKTIGVGAYNWGFVSGKTQTIYPWDSWSKNYQAEPLVWFHDIFRTNGIPYSSSEVQYIRSVTRNQAPSP